MESQTAVQGELLRIIQHVVEGCSAGQVLTDYPDIDALMAAAARHGLLLLLYEPLSPFLAGHCSLPYPVLYALLQRHIEQARNELKRLLDAFAERNLRVFLIKGAAFANLVYGGLKKRVQGDIDLLIEERDIAAVDRVLRELGYVSYYIDYDGGTTHPLPFPLLIQEYHDHYWMYEGEKQVVEIHRFLHFERSLPDRVIGRFMAHSQQYTVDGLTYRSFDLEHSFLNLCENAFDDSESAFAVFNNGMKLRDYVDILAFIHRYRESMDWRRAVGLAAEYHLAGIIRTVFLNLASLFDLSEYGDITAPFLAGIGPGGPRFAWHEPFRVRVFNPEATRQEAERLLVEQYYSRLNIDMSTRETVSIHTPFQMYRPFSPELDASMQILYQHSAGGSEVTFHFFLSDAFLLDSTAKKITIQKINPQALNIDILKRCDASAALQFTPNEMEQKPEFRVRPVSGGQIVDLTIPFSSDALWTTEADGHRYFYYDLLLQRQCYETSYHYCATGCRRLMVSEVIEKAEGVFSYGLIRSYHDYDNLLLN